MKPYFQKVITNHAAEQYQRRWAPEKTIEEARKELSTLFDGAKKIDKTDRGDPIFVSGDAPDVRMVVKDGNVVITVLPYSPKRDIREGLFEDFMEYYEEQLETEKKETEAEIVDAKKRARQEKYGIDIEKIKSRIDVLYEEIAKLDSARSKIPKDNLANRAERARLGKEKSTLWREFDSLRRYLKLDHGVEYGQK